MSEPDRFCIIPIYSDSSGNGAIPSNAVAHGSWSAITGRIRDTKQQRQMLTLINDAEHAKGTLQTIRDREAAVTAREEAVTAREDALNQAMLTDALGKLDATAARFDAYEAELLHDPEDDLLPEPGEPMPDDGDLQAPKHAHEVLDPDFDDPDPDMPRSPVAVEDSKQGAS